MGKKCRCAQVHGDQLSLEQKQSSQTDSEVFHPIALVEKYRLLAAPQVPLSMYFIQVYYNYMQKRVQMPIHNDIPSSAPRWFPS